MVEKIWYACYGSNMLEERFYCYIKGGQPKGAKNANKGCHDKTLPVESEAFYISSELYFSKKSKNWNNEGVAFIKNTIDKNISTIGRIYLITKGQLIDIARQETGTEGQLDLNFDEAIKNCSSIFQRPSWYGSLNYLGRLNDIPIFTLTKEDEGEDFTKPSINYLNTIINGIKEVYNFDNHTILEYLITKKGIVDNYTKEELFNILNNKIEQPIN